jgi:hypothetical protein
MAERRKGPVKPPTLDLTAREAVADAPKPAPRRRPVATPSAAEPTPPSSAPQPEPEREPEPAVAVEPPRDPEPAPEQPTSRETPRMANVVIERGPARTSPAAAVLTAALVGALLGTALTYAVATIVPFPSHRLEIPDLSPLIAEQAERISVLEERFGAVEENAMDAQVALEAANSDARTRLDALSTAFDELRAAAPATSALDEVETRLAALSSRLDAVAAGASSADAGAIAENIAGLEQTIAALSTEVDAANSRGQTLDGSLSALAADVAALKATVTSADSAEAAAEEAADAQLPLLAANLESAVLGARPYGAELASLTGAKPDLTVPDLLDRSAETGLASPDELDGLFAELLPDIVAALPAPPPGDWQQSATEWLRSLLAIRPAGELEGDSPEAVLSRLEAAMARRDYIAASDLFAELPAPMVSAAGELPEQVAAHAAAAQFVASLRTAAPGQ